MPGPGRGGQVPEGDEDGTAVLPPGGGGPMGRGHAAGNSRRRTPGAGRGGGDGGRSRVGASGPGLRPADRRGDPGCDLPGGAVSKEGSRLGEAFCRGAETGSSASVPGRPGASGDPGP